MNYSVQNSPKSERTYLKHQWKQLKCLNPLHLAGVTILIPFGKIIPFGTPENSPASAKPTQKTTQVTNGIRITGSQPTKTPLRKATINSQ